MIRLQQLACITDRAKNSSQSGRVCWLTTRLDVNLGNVAGHCAVDVLCLARIVATVHFACLLDSHDGARLASHGAAVSIPLVGRMGHPGGYTLEKHWLPTELYNRTGMSENGWGLWRDSQNRHWSGLVNHSHTSCTRKKVELSSVEGSQPGKWHQRCEQARFWSLFKAYQFFTLFM